jgi:hypothetical protein
MTVNSERCAVSTHALKYDSARQPAGVRFNRRGRTVRLWITRKVPARLTCPHSMQWVAT